eukprot:Selendium_serpulae@DN4336_c0_g1_i4.p1
MEGRIQVKAVWTSRVARLKCSLLLHSLKLLLEHRWISVVCLSLSCALCLSVICLSVYVPRFVVVVYLVRQSMTTPLMTMMMKMMTSTMTTILTRIDGKGFEAQQRNQNDSQN